MAERTAVAFTAWNRPDYLRQTLDAWSKVRGIEDAVLQFCCEPGCEEVRELCWSVDFAERYVYVNLKQLGASRNTQQALDIGCRRAGYAVLASDDYLPSDDALELHAWHRDNYRDDPTVLALSCWRDTALDGGPAAVWRTQTIGWLHGFHREKWALLSAAWAESRYGDWYQWIDQAWCQRRGYDVLRPALSRAQDIGEFGYQPQPPLDQVQSRCFSQHYPPQQYYEVKGRRECGYLSTWIEET